MYGESSDELQIKTALSKELFQLFRADQPSLNTAIDLNKNLAKLDNHRIINGTFERAFKKSQKLKHFASNTCCTLTAFSALFPCFTDCNKDIIRVL
ncbi:hypothetical protein T07_8384 [Trichinella nelsoni]|uniref:Uncharacterized protein n=1 Tax=Trichinella nelsoni TaxID=6336 RepID=A0A0V0SFH3_9BILA|nr:hypothetical protein T07_8384 [Trichinella nelsoni]